MKPLAAEFRKALWGNRAAPFTNMDEAGCWIQATFEKKTLELGQPTGYSEFSLTFRRKPGHPNRLIESFPRFFTMNGSTNLPSWLGYLAEAYEGWEVVSVSGPSSEADRKLDTTFSNGRRYFWSYSKGGVLERLHVLCRRMAKETGWWSEAGALGFILCDSIPLAGVYAKPPFPGGNYLSQIDIKVSGPATVEEVAEAYKRVLEMSGANPRPMTYVHAKLMQLVWDMPIGEYTWTERLRKWLDWCETDPRLASASTYGAKVEKDGSISNGRYASQNLNGAFKKAVERATWTGKATPKRSDTPFTLTPVPPLPPLPWEEQ